jgi:hypothetical protein
MSIAIIGWGSLIWCPGSLRIRTVWRRDGPRLPIEFARISRDGRLTLVIQLGTEDQTTYWAVSELEELSGARDNVREREGSKLEDVHYLDRGGRVADGVPSEIARKMSEWLDAHGEVQAAIWTGLPSNWREKRGREFSAADAIRYLEELEVAADSAKATYDRAREYVRNAPPGVETRVRKAMRAQGWTDARLAAVLFGN